MIRQCLLDHGHSERGAAKNHVYGSPMPSPDSDPKRCPETIRAALHHVPPVADNLPLSLSESERAAAANPGLPAPPKEPVMSTTVPASGLVPLIPAKFVALALTIGGVLVAAALAIPALGLSLPAWLPLAVGGLGAIALFLGGQSQTGWAPTKPLVPATLVPLFLTLSTALFAVAASMPQGKVQSAVMLAATVCGYLAGKAAPPPLVPVK